MEIEIKMEMERYRHPYRHGDQDEGWMREGRVDMLTRITKEPRHRWMSGFSYKKVAATYSPTWWGSTIGDGELNFSVRNGKRWILTAITATICF